MALIAGLEIRNFRSLREVDLRGLSDVNAITGLNNSGKSNVLRALNLFFNDEVDPGHEVELATDHYSPSRKKRKEISVTVHFDLPSTLFSFGKLFEGVEDLVGHTPSVRRTWSYDRSRGTTVTASTFALDGGDSSGYTELSAEEEIRLLRSFLGLIKYRYLPNHIHPSRVMVDEEDEIKRALLVRLRQSLGRRRDVEAADLAMVFETLNRVAAGVMRPIAESMKAASQEIEEVELVTARDFEDLLFVFGYNVSVAGGTTIPSELQGSGVQAHLMYLLLHFLDTSFAQRFGTRQAVVWGIEEPESFLHMNLEYYLARFFHEAASSGRFQLFCTTHSDIFTRLASTAALAELADGESHCMTMPPRDLVRMAPIKGISRFVHELLYETKPLVLVEGKIDAQYLRRALVLSGGVHPWQVHSLSELLGVESVGGIDGMIRYLRENRSAVGCRSPDAPIVAVADWEVNDRKFNDLHSALAPHQASVAWRPPQDLANPQLDRSFVGIERFLGTGAIIRAENEGWLRLHRPRTSDYPLSVDRESLRDSKKRIAEDVCSRQSDDDFEYLVALVAEIDALVEDAGRRGAAQGDENQSSESLDPGATAGA